MAPKLNLHRVVFSAVLAASLTISVLQIMNMIKNWNERPFDVVEQKLDKHQVPFPSVSICAEGSTLFPAIEVLLERQKLDASKFPSSYEAYIRIQWKKIEMYYQSKPVAFPSRTLKAGCDQNKEELIIYCKFLTLVLNSVELRLQRKLLGQTVIELFESTDRTMGLYEKVEANIHRKSDKPNSLHERNYYAEKEKMLEKNKASWKLVRVYLYLLLLNVLESKRNNPSIDVMEKFISLIKVQGQLDRINATLANCFYPPPLSGMTDPDIVLHYSITEESFSEANNDWTSKLENEKNDVKLYDFIKCYGSNSDNVFLESFGVFLQLVYLHTFDFSRTLPLNLANLISHNAKYDVPAKTEKKYIEELNKELKSVTENIFNINNPFSLKDIMDIMTTKGIYTMKEKATWNKKSDERTACLRNASVTYTEASYTVDYRKILDNPAVNPNPQAQWSSLSPLDEKCFMKINTKTNFSSVCNNIKECFEYCSKTNQFLMKTKRENWLDIMSHASHPPTFQEPNVKSRSLTWLLPFCMVGKKLLTVINTIKRGENYPFENKPFFGYQFCMDAKLMISDYGLCTTFNFPDYKDFLSSNVALNRHGSLSADKWVPIYPEKTVSDLFEEGILLILDSWAVEEYIMRLMDNDVGLNDRGTPLESLAMNYFKVVLHDKNEIPMFHSHDASYIYLDQPKFPTDQSSVKVYKTRIDAEKREADARVKRHPVSERQCKFEDEIEGLHFFTVYSKQNCMFECKLRVAEKNCGCVPWDFPAAENTKICNIFGNVCFQNELIRLKRDISDEKESLGTPPCGCYPSCNKIKYILLDQQPDYSDLNPEWIDLVKSYGRFISYNQLNALNVTYWMQYTQETNSDGFLFRYISDVFRNGQSVFNPNRTKLIDYDISLYTAQMTLKKKTLEGRLRNLALLYIDFDKQEYVNRRLVLRVTAADMISALGGTLGLFTGFSFLAMVDVGFWICKAGNLFSTFKGLFK